MKAELSKYLQENKPALKKLVADLSEDFQYVSVLGTDTKGTTYRVKSSGTAISDSRTVERGFVVRVFNGIGYSEYSFNDLDFVYAEKCIRKAAEKDAAFYREQGIAIREYNKIEEEELTQSYTSELQIHPEAIGAQKIVEELATLVAEGMAYSDQVIELQTIYDWAQVSKIFISTKRDLEQSYLYSTGYLIPYVRGEKSAQYSLKSFSGLKGFELIEEMKNGLSKTIDNTLLLLKAKRIVPGEYEIICDPNVSGLIAHEAFGHGVEMDMFVKKRALGEKYVGQKVASAITNMRDGATGVEEVSSYLFDDEGVLGGNTLIIENGILKNGISDLLSAMALGSKPTGNGKRESFERKAYSRMTNTYFEKGKDKLEDMIASISHGYFLEDFESGMEDPKNWGIQCVAARGYEIIDGKLTDHVVAPVYLTGYVPDLLGSFSMISDGELILSGSGFCGKGHKELVKTSTGGTYIKAIGRLS
ncbi:TldD/PmbA family protein [Clostridiales bacterium COT073_COT-073]|nr:TldD/PmbA family protein [Clostridiales bacterium COT073_COT-073]